MQPLLEHCSCIYNYLYRGVSLIALFFVAQCYNLHSAQAIDIPVDSVLQKQTECGVLTCDLANGKWIGGTNDFITASLNFSLFGDVDGDGIVKLGDILCVIDGFSDEARCPTADICPCGGNQEIDVDDIIGIMAAYNGAALRCEDTCPSSTLCGNNFIDAGEECDDGNQFSADGCSAHCFVEDCVNNRLPTAHVGQEVTGLVNEQIRFSASASKDLDGYIIGQWWNFGDGFYDRNEVPLGQVLVPQFSHRYSAVGTYQVTLWVKDNCGEWSPTILPGTPGDTSHSQAVITSCGNGTLDSWEQCDGFSFPALLGDSRACRDYDPQYESGEVACNQATCLVDVSDCRVAQATCGNNIVEGAEQCDAPSFPAENSFECSNSTRSCDYSTQTLSFTDGFDSCVSGCTCQADVVQTSSPSDSRYCSSCSDHCGDGVINCGEVCDPGRTEACPGGTRSCRADCRGWNACVPSTATCGNGVINSEEQCDCGPGWNCTSAELGGGNCSTFQLSGGNLGCHPPGSALGCSFDRSACTGTEQCLTSPAPAAIHPLSIQAVVNVPILLDASQSYDSDGYIKEYSWTYFGANFGEQASPGETIQQGQMLADNVRTSRPVTEYTYLVPGIDQIQFEVTDNCGKTNHTDTITITVVDICGNNYRGNGELCERGETRSCAYGSDQGIQSCNATCNGWNPCATFQCPEGHNNNGNGTCTATFFAHPADGYGFTEINLGIPWNTLRDVNYVRDRHGEGYDAHSDVFLIKNTINPKLFGGEKSYLSRYAMSFNTSSLPNDANILTSTISLTSFGNAINNKPMGKDFITIVNASLPLAPSFASLRSSQTNTEYIFNLGDNLNPQEATTYRLDISRAYAQNREFLFPLNLSGKKQINTTGWTSFAVRGGYDVDGLDDGTEIVKLAAGFLSGNALNGRPKLTITYNVNPTRAVCGNDRIDSAEQCDGLSLANQTCQARGFVGGDLHCSFNCQFDTTQCFQQFPYCLEQGDAVPNLTNRPSCCSGLSMIAPKLSTDSSILGICTDRCGNGICEVDSESVQNCNVDCRFHNNSKNISLYAAKEAFVSGDLDWQTVLTYLPVTVWTDASGIQKYPFLIYHQDNTTFPKYPSKITADSFLQTSPKIYNNHVVWRDFRNEQESELYYCNKTKNGQPEGCNAADQKRRVTLSDQAVDKFQLYGNRIAWIQTTSAAAADVFICDLTLPQSTPGACYSTSAATAVTKRVSTEDFATGIAGLSDQYLVWNERMNQTTFGWFACDLRLSPGTPNSCNRNASKRVLQLPMSVGNLTLDAGRLAFVVDQKIATCDLNLAQGQTGACFPENWTYVQDQQGFYNALTLHNDTLYWFDYDSFYRHSLITGETSLLSTPGKRDQVTDLAVHDSTMVFTAGGFFGEDFVMRYDIGSDRYSILARNAQQPSIYGNTIVWAEAQNNQWDIVSNQGSPTQILQQGIDADAVVNFLQDYNPGALTLIGQTAAEVDALLTSAPPLGSGIDLNRMSRVSPENFLSFWSNYTSVVYVDQDYELALLASSYASLLNAPLIIQNSFHDRAQTYSGRSVLCVGATSPFGSTCTRRYSLDQLRERYLASTNTDKVILVNPDDLTMAADTSRVLVQSIEPDKSPTPVFELFTKASLAAPILAATKHELVYSTHLRTWKEIDAVVKSLARDLFQSVPLRYLTIVASSHQIPKERKSLSTIFAADDRAVDNSKYAEVTHDACTDLRTGRINGYTLSDISALMVRSIFVRDIFVGNNAFMMFLFGPSTDNFFRPIQYQFDDWSMMFSEEEAYLNEDLARQKIRESNLIYYHDHGNVTGFRGMRTYEMQAQDVRLPYPIVSVNACDTCGGGDYGGVLCYEALRRGAIAYQGAVDTNQGTTHDDYFAPFYAEGLPLGEARNKKLNLFQDSYTDCGGDSYYLLFGDPTLTFSDFGYERRCQGIEGPCCGNNRVDPGEQCDGVDYAGNTCHSLGFSGGGHLYCSSSCTFETSVCKEFDCTNNIPPVAIAGPDQTGRVGQVITFNASQSYDPTPGGYVREYWWGFGDQTGTGWEENPIATHTYSAPGTYRVALVIADNCPGSVSQAQDELTVTIQP